MFTERHRAMLKAVARDPHKAVWTKNNPQLDELIEKLKLQASMNFLTDEDMKHRVFFHKPAHCDTYAGYITDNFFERI